MAEKIDKIRDMVPYCDILKQFATYHLPGQPITIFEIGVRRGASTISLLNGLNNRLFEPRGDMWSCDVTDRAYISNDDKWNFIYQASQDIEWSDPIDILMIDGEHTYKAVKRDYEKYEPFVKEGGLIILHDMNPGATDAARFWPEIMYPKIILNFNFSGLGVATKVCRTLQ